MVPLRKTPQPAPPTLCGTTAMNAASPDLPFTVIVVVFMAAAELQIHLFTHHRPPLAPLSQQIRAPAFVTSLVVKKKTTSTLVRSPCRFRDRRVWLPSGRVQHGLLSQYPPRARYGCQSSRRRQLWKAPLQCHPSRQACRCLDRGVLMTLAEVCRVATGVKFQWGQEVGEVGSRRVSVEKSSRAEKLMYIMSEICLVLLCDLATALGWLAIFLVC